MATALPGIGNAAPKAAGAATAERRASAGSTNQGLLPTLASPRSLASASSPRSAVANSERKLADAQPAVAATPKIVEQQPSVEPEVEPEASHDEHHDAKGDAQAQLSPVAGSVCSTDSHGDNDDNEHGTSLARSLDMARSEDGMGQSDNENSSAQRQPAADDEDAYSEDEFENDGAQSAAPSTRRGEAQPRGSVVSSADNSKDEVDEADEVEQEDDVEEDEEVVRGKQEEEYQRHVVPAVVVRRTTTTTTATVTQREQPTMSPRPPPRRPEHPQSRSAPGSRSTSVESFASSQQSGSGGRTQLHGHMRSPRTNNRKLRVVRHSPRSPRVSGTHSAPGATGQPSLGNQVAFGSMYKLTPAPGPGAYDTTRHGTATAVSPRAPKYSMAVRTKAVAQDRFILRAEALSRQVPGPGAHNVARSSFGTQSLCKTSVPWSKVSVSRLEATGGNAPTYSFGKRETGRFPGGSPRSDAARARASPLLGSSAMMAKKNYGVHSPGPGSFHIKSTVGTGGTVGSLAAAPRAPRTHRFSRAPRF